MAVKGAFGIIALHSFSSRNFLPCLRACPVFFSLPQWLFHFQFQIQKRIPFSAGFSILFPFQGQGGFLFHLLFFRAILPCFCRCCILLLLQALSARGQKCFPLKCSSFFP